MSYQEVRDVKNLLQRTGNINKNPMVVELNQIHEEFKSGNRREPNEFNRTKLDTFQTLNRTKLFNKTANESLSFTGTLPSSDTLIPAQGIDLH